MNEKYVKVDDIIEYCNDYSAYLGSKGQGVAQAALRRIKEFAKENIADVQPVKHGRWITKAEDYYKENGGVVITNPNAPTSICESLDFIRDILAHNSDSIVVVDEAYIDFGGETALPLLREFDNLIVVRTFSKSRSMAGLRVGYAVASAEIIKALNDVKYSINSYTLNMPAIELATLAVESEAYYEEITAKIIATREWTVKELATLGFECLPSSANFVFAKHNSVDAETIFNALKAEGIFVRYFKAPRINEYLRITIGTDEEMGKVVEFLKNYFMEN